MITSGPAHDPAPVLYLDSIHGSPGAACHDPNGGHAQPCPAHHPSNLRNIVLHRDEALPNEPLDKEGESSNRYATCNDSPRDTNSPLPK